MKRFLILLGILCFPAVSQAYLFKHAPTLDELNSKVDVIFKGIAVETSPIEDSQMRDVPGYTKAQTRFRVVSTLKGADLIGDSKEVYFHHYPNGINPLYSPQIYRFHAGKPYLVWAKRDASGVLRPFANNHTSIMETGAMLAGDEREVSGQIRSVIWSELQTLMAGDAASQLYAVQKLRHFIRRDHLDISKHKNEFTEDEMWAMAFPLLESQLQAKTSIIGEWHFSNQGPEWLAVATMKTLSKLNFERVLPELLRLSRASPIPGVRAGAFECLSQGADPRILEAALDALNEETDLEIRRFALESLGAFASDERAKNQIIHSSRSPLTEIHHGAITAIGKSKSMVFFPILEELLVFSGGKHEHRAAEILWSFPSQQAQALWERQAKNPRLSASIRSRFLTAAAQAKPQKYRNELRAALQIQHKENVWDYHLWPAFLSAVMASPEANAADFDLLEKESASVLANWGDLYRAYLLRGEKERAARLKATKTTGQNSHLLNHFRSIELEIEVIQRQAKESAKTSR